MNPLPVSPAFLILPLVMAAVSLGWSIAVIVLLVKIWRKVRNLPG